MWALLLHGGATEIPADKQAAYRAGCMQALETGRKILQGGGSAIDAVMATVISLEIDPTFNAGYGCALNHCGEVEMSAAIMDGQTMDIGAVATLKGIKSAITAAHLMLRRQTILIAGEGAYNFAAEHDIERCDPKEYISPERKAGFGSKHDTVGCIALDAAGNTAAASSTGGIDGRPAGRIGDSPLPGCGYYAENRVGAVTLSGDGEHIARMVLAARIMNAIPDNGPQQAAEQSIAKMQRIGGEAGAIVLGADGSVGWAHSSPEFAVGIVTSERAPQVFLRRNEDAS